MLTNEAKMGAIVAGGGLAGRALSKRPTVKTLATLAIAAGAVLFATGWLRANSV